MSPHPSSRLRGLSLLVAVGAAAASLAASLATAPATAREGATAGELIFKLQLCRSVGNRAFRLNCFDRLARDTMPEDERLSASPSSPADTDPADRHPADSRPADSRPAGPRVASDRKSDRETAPATENQPRPTESVGWAVADWTSPLTGVRDLTITRASEDAGREPISLLSFSCTADAGAVRVRWPLGAEETEVQAALVFDGEAEEPTTWTMGTDGRTMSRENRSRVAATARKVAAAGRVGVRMETSTGRVQEATFDTAGLKEHVSALAAACGG